LGTAFTQITDFCVKGGYAGGVPNGHHWHDHRGAWCFSKSSSGLASEAENDELNGTLAVDSHGNQSMVRESRHTAEADQHKLHVTPQVDSQGKSELLVNESSLEDEDDEATNAFVKNSSLEDEDEQEDEDDKESVGGYKRAWYNFDHTPDPGWTRNDYWGAAFRSEYWNCKREGYKLGIPTGHIGEHQEHWGAKKKEIPRCLLFQRE